ncbi:hypothetical protein ACSNOI_23425 [Actinomadura kijaniata]|uniref:hypothetical protein n=1 Tax=Actinomadura kijaniata TaxID=46161 RepID=UPI003F1D4028
MPADVLGRRSLDLAPPRGGRLTLGKPHPLVRGALFPARPPADGPAGAPKPALSAAMAGTCRCGRHEPRFRDGAATPRERDRNAPCKRSAADSWGASPWGPPGRTGRERPLDARSRAWPAGWIMRCRSPGII